MSMHTYLKEKGFKCPFHIKGEKENTILRITLPFTREKRLQAMINSIREYHEKPILSSIIFTFPDGLLSFRAKTNLSLVQKALLQYQCEFLACDLHCRISPFWSYEFKKIGIDRFTEEVKRRPVGMGEHLMLRRCMRLLGVKDPKGPIDLFTFIYDAFKKMMERDSANPTIRVYADDQFTIPVLDIMLDGFVSYVDSEFKGDVKKNRNLFYMIMGPFYEQAFGRHADETQLVITREADFLSLSEETRRTIRKASNTVLRDNHVVIEDLLENRQPGGLWFPQMA